eukprot:11786580-Heterocapsa_arctica.AAC.1
MLPAKISYLTGIAWAATVNFDRLGLSEIGCASDNLTIEEMQKLGGRAERYSFWNGYDLTQSTGAQKLFKELIAIRPRKVWFSPPCAPDSSTSRGSAHHRRKCEQDPDLTEKRARNQKIQLNLLGPGKARGYGRVRVLHRAARQLRLMAR